jgi:hypothetical protein
MRTFFSTIVLYILIISLNAQTWAVCVDQKTKKYGVCYADTIKIPQVYDFAQFVNSHEFIVAANGKYGVMDRYSNYIIQPIYDKIWEFTELENELLVQQGNKYGIINFKGKPVVPMYEIQEGEINTFHVDAHLSFAHPWDDFQVIKDGKMAIYNMEGHLVFDFLYPFVQDIEVIPVDEKKHKYKIFLVGDKGNYSFVDAHNKPIFKDIKVEDMYNVYHAWGSHTKGIMMNGKTYFINTETGALLNPSEMADMLEDFNMVQNLEDKMGGIAADGTVKVKCQYDNMVELIETNHALVEVNGKKGLINYDGDVLIEPLYDNVQEICFDAQDPTKFPFSVNKGDWYAVFIYDTKLKKMVAKTPFKFESITCFENTKDGMKAYLTDSTGKKGFLLPGGKIEMSK